MQAISNPTRKRFELTSARSTAISPVFPLSFLSLLQKKPHVRNFSARNSDFYSGAENGSFLLENPHAHKIPGLGGSGGFGFFKRGGGEVPILLLWARACF